MPQISELLKQIKRYIQFEVEVMSTPIRIFGGGKVEGTSSDDEEFHEATEDDINLLAQILSGSA